MATFAKVIPVMYIIVRDIGQLADTTRFTFPEG